MKRKHLVVVEITFETKVTEKFAVRAVEKMIELRQEQWFQEISFDSTPQRYSLRSGNRMIAGFKSRMKILTEALRKYNENDSAIS